MNKFKFASLFLLLVILAKTYAVTRTITVGNLIFTPTPAAVTVGDSIKWVWVNGIHTTTSTTIPAGAVPWNAPIDSAHTSFIYVITAAGQYNYYCIYHYKSGMIGTINASPIGINNISVNIPEKFELYQNYPNPFNPSTNIEFDIAENGFVSLKVFDITGKEAANLVNENLQKGTYKVDWYADGLTSGTYFYTLKASNFTETKRMMLIK